MSHQVNIFISHSWAYSDDYDRISEWLCGDAWSSNGVPVVFYDCSVPRDNPIHFATNEETLRQVIYERIATSHVVIIPTGVYATYSKWIGKEISGAQLHQKPIVAVDGWGAQRTSTIVQDAAAQTVGWRKQSVADAVWRQYTL